MPNQININVTDIIPPDNIATVDSGGKIGSVFTKAQTDLKIGSAVSGFRFSINPETPIPTDGWQNGTYPAEESGTYPNQDDIIVDLEDGYTALAFNGTSWVKIVYPNGIVPIDFLDYESEKPVTSKAIIDYTPTKEDVDSFIVQKTLNKDLVFIFQKNNPIKEGSAISLSVSNLLFTGFGDYNVNIQDSNGNYLIVKRSPKDETIVAKAIQDADWLKVQLGFDPTITYFTADTETRYGTSAESLRSSNKINNLENAVIVEPDLLVNSYTNTGNVTDYLYGEGVYFGYKKLVDKESVLSSHKMRLNGATSALIGEEFEFAVGVVDQRPIFIPRLFLKCKVSAVTDGITVHFDFSDQKTILRAGEGLFCKSKPVGSGSDATLALTAQTYDANNQLLSTSNLSENLTKNTVRGATLFQTEVAEVNSIFATKDTLSNYDAQIASLQNAVSKINKYTDTVTSDKYELKVVNGELELQSLDFHKILVIGHSFVNYFDAPSLDWHLDDLTTSSAIENRAMASSVYENQWALMLADAFGAELERVLGVDFELNYSPTYDFATKWVVEEPNPDAICIYLSDNATYNSTMQASWEAMLTYLKTTYPTAKIFCTGGWDSNNKETDIRNACHNSLGVDYVNVVGLNVLENKWRVGDYYFGRSNQYYPMGAANSHPNDKGHFDLANKFLSVMGGNPIQNIKNITLNQIAGGFTETPNNNWVVGGLVTIRAFADSGKTINSITVTKSGGGTVTATKRTNDKFNPGKTRTYFTFIMPDDNVTVTPTWI